MLHDIGHGPFSHVLENTIVQGVSHEDISLMLMERINKELNGQLKLAIQLFKDEYPKRFLHQLVSGQLDMDRLDYLRRDSFYTGAVSYTHLSHAVATLPNPTTSCSSNIPNCNRG